MFFRPPFWKVGTRRSPRGVDKAQNLSYSAVRNNVSSFPRVAALCWNWCQRTIYSPSNTTRCIPRCWTWCRHWWCLTLHAMAPSQVNYRLRKTTGTDTHCLCCVQITWAFFSACAYVTDTWNNISFVCIYLNLGPVSQKRFTTAEMPRFSTHADHEWKSVNELESRAVTWINFNTSMDK